MTEEKGILDDVEELVSDFKKEKTSLKNSLLDFVDQNKDFFKQEYSTYSDTTENKNQREFRDSYKDYLQGRYGIERKEPEYNNKMKFHCESCGIIYIVCTKQELESIDSMAGYMEGPNQYSVHEKPFYCLKCGRMTYMRASLPFEIVSIKHEESLKI